MRWKTQINLQDTESKYGPSLELAHVQYSDTLAMVLCFLVIFI